MASTDAAPLLTSEVDRPKRAFLVGSVCGAVLALCGTVLLLLLHPDGFGVGAALGQPSASLRGPAAADLELLRAMPAELRGNATLPQLVSMLSEVRGTAGKPGSPDIPCVVEQCGLVVAKCAAASLRGDTCLDALRCDNHCNTLGHNQSQGCAYLCEMTYGYKSPAFLDVVKCMTKQNKAGEPRCFTPFPQDGKCLAADADAVTNLTSEDQLEGSWFVVKGVNCGQQADGTPFHNYPHRNPTPGLNFPGGYDWYPCQHSRFMRNPSMRDNQGRPTTAWINNITYCGGANGGLAQCNTSVIDTIANITMCAPGAVCHSYTDSPLTPQFEHWRVISWPHPDWLANIWCGGTPLVNYNGGLIFSRAGRSGANMPAYVAEAFRAAYAKHGVDFDEMCESTNEECP